MNPSVGRIVHYRQSGSCRAAIVTDVLDGGPGIGIDSISLCVCLPLGFKFCTEVGQDEDRKVAGTWHWPEREA